MNESYQRGAQEGAVFGLLAGVIFALAEVMASSVMGQPPLTPFRMFASTLLGQVALDFTPLATTIMVGGTLHLILSVVFGLVYGLINARFSLPTQTRWGRQVGLGLLFGTLVWLVNFQLIGRALYPWLQTTPPFMQMSLHAICFGLPLALMYASTERRVHRIGRGTTIA